MSTSKTYTILLLSITILAGFASAQSTLCLPPCTTCQDNSPVMCKTCILGFNLIGNFCAPYTCPVLYCRACDSNGNCLVCQNNFMLSNNTCICQGNFAPSLPGSPTASCVCPGPLATDTSISCITCPIQGCQTCANATSCMTCLQGYSTNSNGGCVICSIPNCQTCLVNNFCAACLNNLTVSTQGTCVVCNTASPGCVECDISGNCVCASGYLSVPGNATTCQACGISQCQFCRSDSTCFQCNPSPYTASGSGCAYVFPLFNLCPSSCLTCNRFGACLACVTPYYKIDSFGNCLRSTIAFCKTYNIGTGLCLTCFSGYSLSSNGTECKYNYNNYCNGFSPVGSCISCYITYTVVKGGCYACNAGPGCWTCTTDLTTCLTCLYGFYLQNGRCLACQPYCYSCSNSYSCISYKDNVASMVQVVDNNAFTLALCPSSCSACSKITLGCIFCATGFYSAGKGICAPCQPSSNCQTCSMANPSICLTCPDNYFTSGSICITCTYPCLTCTSLTSLNNCTSCSPGYKLTNNTCILSSCTNPLCMFCSLPGVCIQCLPGFFLTVNGTNTTCLPGSPSCNMTATSTNPSICISCYPGTSLDYYSNNCQMCPDNCLVCNLQGTCIQCMDGFYRTGNPDQVCAPNCILPCMTCLNNNPSSCLSCIAGYDMKSGVCVARANCTSCQYCPLGYGLLAPQQCLPCNVTNCATCNLNSPNCTGCLPGYYLSISQCLACTSGCQSCTNAISCQTCSIGFTMLLYPFYNGSYNAGICISCESPCMTCWGHPTACLSCIQGYTRKSTRCMTNTFYSGSVTLDVTNSTYQTIIANYQTILTQSLSSIGLESYLNFFVTGFQADVSNLLSTAMLTFQIGAFCNTTTCFTSGVNSMKNALSGPVATSLKITNLQVFLSAVQPNDNNQNTTTTTNCSSPCASCSIQGGSICLSCYNGFTVVNNTCVNAFCPILYCSFCVGNTCLRCLPSFSLINNMCVCQNNYQINVFNSPNSTCICSLPANNCILCIVPNCLGCSSPTNCTQCASGFNVTALGTCNNCTIANCVTCSATGLCTLCMANYSLAANGSCALCNVSNCQVCSDLNNCAKCAQGYQMITTSTSANNTMQTCIECSIQYCSSCSLANNCSACMFGYTLNNNTCTRIVCPYSCQLCYGNGTCQFCRSPPYSFNPVNGVCVACAVPNCFTCNATNNTVCTLCSNGYILDPTNSSNCISQHFCITYSQTGTCTGCQPLYVLNSNNTCVACLNIQGCLNCSSQNLTVCTNCLPGFFLSNGSCNQCPPLCAVCTNTSCLNYTSQVSIISSLIVYSTCLPSCFCNTSNPYVCAGCQVGYYLMNSTCLPCNPNSNCRTCNATFPSQCTSCISGGLIQIIASMPVCVYCDFFCQQCAGLSNCTICVAGYAPINGVCKVQGNCSSACVICQNSICVQCMIGYNPDSLGNCWPAVAGCVVHYLFNPFICLQCIPGTRLDPISSTCAQCPTNCYLCSTGQLCLECSYGYYLTGQNSTVCAPDCIYPCLSCMPTNASFCLSCLAGYTFNPTFANQCQPTTNCSSKSNCSICPGGFVLNSTAQCLACNPSCLSCTTSNPNSCTSCPTAHYVNSGLCVPCFQGCMNCTSSSYCLSCGVGYMQLNYYPGMVSSQPLSSCTPCQFPCLGCSVLTNYCTSCLAGYILVGTQCLNGNYYMANITLTAVNNTFLTNYGALVTLIANTVAPNYPSNLANLFPATYSKSGDSITYSLYISSQCLPQTLCSQNQAKILTSLITNTSSLANMSVTAASVTANFKTNGSSNPTLSCSSPCQSCNQITGACTTCISGFTVVNGACLNQSCTIPNCKQCSSTNVCSACLASFILNANACVCRTGFFIDNGTCACIPTTGNLQSIGGRQSQVTIHANCVVCRVKNCLDCLVPTSCTLCAAGYSLNLKNLCVQCNVENCVSCSSNNYCGQCQAPLRVNALGSCIAACVIANCRACTSAISCAACSHGFEFDVTRTACIRCSIPDCETCSSNNVCALCERGYLPNADATACKISKCRFPCLSCLAGSEQCASCRSPPFNPTPAANGQCFTCSVANCLTCSFDKPSVCLACASQFTLSNGTCNSSCTQAVCRTCNPNATNICLNCAPTFTLATNGTCVSCSSGCLSCASSDPTQCVSCLPGFYLSGSNCLSCPSFCANCNSNSTCSQLAQSKGRVFASVNGGNVLAICDQGCTSCVSINPSVCLVCQSGYYLSSTDICIPCALASNCQACNTTNSTQCTNCFANAFLLADGTCGLCQQPCLTCLETNTSACITCPLGYLLQNSSCISGSCPLYCSTCSNSTFCSQCMSGYVSINGVCTPCLAGCSQCSTTSIASCQSCVSGTYLDPTSGTCIGCSLNCATCLPNGCTTCLTDFYLTSNLTCAPNCLVPCATCSATDPTICLSCTLGYTFNSTAIQNCAPSLSCNFTFSCGGCPMGMVLQNMQCFNCSSNCVRCLTTSPSTCTSCLSNQYLSANASCLSCSTGCQQCISNSICLACSSGFTSIVVASSGSPVKCAACVSPCATCQGSTKFCQTCVSGFTLKKRKCQSNFNFGFTITLNVDAATFYTNYVAFLTALAANVGLDYGSVSINSILPGSTAVDGTVTTSAQSGTPESTTQFQGLTNTVSAQSTIASMTVINSNVIANGGNPNQQSSSSTPTWVIVVAVVVPVVVLIIIAIVVIVLCKKKKNLDRSSENPTQFYRTERAVQMSVRRPMY